jgi:FtsP/CotA-like multicopper oxidase with cupredoxin domain
MILYRINCLAISTDDGNGKEEKKNDEEIDQKRINLHPSDSSDSTKDTNEENESPQALESKPYTFNKKVIVGIAIIISISAIATIFAMSISQSSSINLYLNIFLPEEKKSIPTVNAISSDLNENNNIDRKFVLIQKDFGWNGTNFGPTIEVSKGDVVQIVIINAGTMAHNFGMAKISPHTLNLLNQTTPVPTPEKLTHISYDELSANPCPECNPIFEKGHIKTFLKPLSQQVITFTANEVGEFKYFCMVRGHLWLGMFGDFIVKENSL